MKNFKLLCSAIVIMIIFLPQWSFATDADSTQSTDRFQEQAVRVYLDVDRDYVKYIKDEIPFVNYVRDRKQGQVYVMITEKWTGAGGREHTIKLIGQQQFDSVNDTLTFHSKQLDTEEIIRSGLVNTLKIGLMRYISKTPQAKFLEINYKKEASPTDVEDKWNNWVFTFDVDVDVEGEESKEELDVDASFSANRVTPDLKIAVEYDNEFRNERYKDANEWIESTRKGREFEGIIVKSLTDHMSYAGYTSISSSSYSNLALAATVLVGVEYNIFPYSEYTERELRLMYAVGPQSVKYEEETLYGKTAESLGVELFSVAFVMKKRWGSLFTAVEASNYLHDFSKNRLELYCNLNFLLFEGFSVNLHGGFSAIRDQLSLPKENATREEILLNRRQIATDYQYEFSIGFRYTFGSIYSNVVNPRFGD